MSCERLADRLKNFGRIGIRSALASTLLIATDWAPPVHTAALNQFSGNRPVSARELASPENQDTPLTVEAMKQLIGAFSSKERRQIAQLLHPTEKLVWGIFDNPNPAAQRTREEILDMFVESLGRWGVPQCIGYRWSGPALEVYFDKLSVAPFRFMTGSALVVLLPDKQANMRLAVVEEIQSGSEAKAKSGLRPCSSIQTQPVVPKAAPLPRPTANVAPRPTPTETRNSEIQDTPLTREILARYIPLIEGMDLRAIAQNFHSKGALTWNLAGQYRSYYDRPTRTQAQMLSLFQESFNKRGAPRAVGYFWEMAYLGILFENFGAPSISGSGYSFVGLISDASAKPPYMRIYSIDELGAADVASAKQQVTPYRGQLRPTPTPTPEVGEVPKDLPAGKIVFIVSDEKNNGHVYIANPDGTERQRLTEGTRIRRQVRWLDSQTLVYVLGGDGGGIVVYSLVTGEARQITKESDWDPHRAGKGIVFSRLKAYAEQDLFYVDRDGGNLRQLTSDGIYNDEEHPAISPDGKLIAYSSHTPGQHGRPNGATIEDWETLAQNFDPDRRPVFIQGAVPIAWSPDSKTLFFVKFETIGGRVVGVGYITDKNGKGLTRLVEGLAAPGGSGSWTPDGKYIITSLQPARGGDAQPYLLPVSGGSPIKLFSTQDFVDSIDWQPSASAPAKKIETRRKIVLAPGLINEIKNGQLVGGAFDELIAGLAHQKKYDILRDIHLLSLGGWQRDGKKITLKDQDCTETLKGQDYGARLLLQYIQDLGHNEQYTFIGHSWGTIVILRALEIAQKEGMSFNWQGMEVRLLHGPIQGQSKSGLAHLASIGTPDLPVACKNILGTPSPVVGSYKTLIELLEMWDNYKERYEQLSSEVGVLEQKGADLIAFANRRDYVISSSNAWMDELMLDILLLKGRRLPILTQELPGGKTIWRDYPTLEYLGHREFLRGKGLEEVLRTISPQVVSPN